MGAPENYNDVAARQREFFAKHPDGSLQQVSVKVYEIEGVSYLAYTAACYRHPNDELPGHGTAWERVPGLTNFTRNSELQNAETSAFGRAIVAVGAADTKKGIATREDVESRMAEADYYASPEYAEQQYVPGLRSSVRAAIGKLDEDAKADLAEWFIEQDLPRPERMTVEQCERVIDHLVGPVPGGEGEQT